MEHNNKIKNLTDKIYREGIEKANEDALLIISKSKKEAEIILDNATKEADKIVNQAEKEALNIAERMRTELRLSSQQSLGVLRKEITELVQAKVLEEPLQKVFKDHEFMRKMLEMLIKKWNPHNGDSGLHVLMPKDRIEETELYFKEKAGSLLNNGLSFSADRNLQNGFEILPKNGNYKISISDSAFEAFLSTHFKERIIDFLFIQEN